MTSISPIAFSVSGISVHWYGIMITIGVLAAVALASVREVKMGLPKDTSLNVILIALPVAILAARLYYVAFSWEYFGAHPSEILSIRSGGLAIYGGLIGGILTGIFYARIKRISALKLADLVAPCLAIGQAFGRWGNFFNQEAYGNAITSQALHFFPIGVFIDAQGGWFYATFFYESIWCALICSALLLAERKKWLLRPGDGICWYVLAYAAERVAVEGLRTDSLYLGSIRVSQLLSALLLFGAALAFLLRAKDFSLLPFLLPSALQLIVILIGAETGFAVPALLSMLQLFLSLYSYNIIRKKASLP